MKKTVKQILEHYNIYNTNKIGDKLKAIADSGLLDESKLPLLKNALTKESQHITNAEKKVYEELVHSLVEKKESLVKSTKNRKTAPQILVLRRKSIKIYPDNQVVALYYSDVLDRFFSIPFDADTKNVGVLGVHMSEEKKSLYRTKRSKETDLSDLSPSQRALYTATQKRREKEEKIKSLAANISDKEALGDPELYQAKRELNRASGKSTAYKVGRAATLMALHQWAKRKAKKAGNVEPTQAEISTEKQPEPVKKFKAPKWVRKEPGAKTPPPPVAAGPVRKKTDKPEEYSKSSFVTESFRNKLQQIREEKQIDEALPLAPIAGAAIRGIAAAAPRLARMVKKARVLGKRSVRQYARNKLKQNPKDDDSKSSASQSTPVDAKETRPAELGRKLAKVSGELGSTISRATERERTRQMWKESTNFDILKNIVNENLTSLPIVYGENEITINNRVAKKIMNIHESLNKENKRKVEKMINEDVNSLKKIINFAIRQ